ncbi:hypothetical protein [Bacillus sp. JCM 19041]|uniref:hypothetical protein n=1 Tax=Bacillus sp. JCM 19041 TaxID=1460637 RepID=UPI0006D023E4
MDANLQQLLDICYETLQPKTNCLLRDYSTNPQLLLQWTEKATQLLPLVEDPIECYELNNPLSHSKSIILCSTSLTKCT